MSDTNSDNMMTIATGWRTTATGKQSGSAHRLANVPNPVIAKKTNLCLYYTVVVSTICMESDSDKLHLQKQVMIHSSR